MRTRVGIIWRLGVLIALLCRSASPAQSADLVVEIDTSLGEIQVLLDSEHAPASVENFLRYVDSGFYDGTIFHRVIEGFLIHGGGFTESLKAKKTYPAIELESRNGLKNEKYTVSMARLPGPNSATSQFFINTVDNPRLDYPNPDGHGYAVFGRVIGGFEVVDKIGAVKTTTRGRKLAVPVEAVQIREIRTTSGRAAAPPTGG